MSTPVAGNTASTVSNVLYTWYDFVELAMRKVAEHRLFSEGAAGVGSFAPRFALPERSHQLREFFAPSSARVVPLGEHGGHGLHLLDLMMNPGTRTTKTLASLVIVARAVRHVHDTGERISIVTPSSANKATALRYAVHRAIESGLATADQLNIVTLVPAASRNKLWSSPLAEDPDLRARNPMLVLAGENPGEVKNIVSRFVREEGQKYWDRTGRRLWHTLNPANYMVADAVRARIEAAFLPPGEPRWHAHSVSSAYGLLGHDFGVRLLGEAAESGAYPSYLLVQHLGRPDMVQHVLHGRFDQADLPRYALDDEHQMYVQGGDPHFPAVVHEPNEFLESTFYTEKPATAPAMSDIIRAQGGSGIVVSLRECLDHYPRLRALLEPVGIELPADPRKLLEWSLVMALTGVLVACDRGVVPAAANVLVHASGSYSAADFTRLSDLHVQQISGYEEFASHLSAVE